MASIILKPILCRLFELFGPGFPNPTNKSILNYFFSGGFFPAGAGAFLSPAAGLFLSVVLVGTLARFFAKQIQNYKWIGYAGLIAILVVALQLIIGGLDDLGVIAINESFKKFF